VPTKEHFIFDGYFYSTDSTSKQYVDEKGNWITPWEYESDGTLYAHWHLDLPSLTWAMDISSSVSSINIIRGGKNEGDRVQMRGNRSNPGKGAAWVEWEGKDNWLRLTSIEFDYNIEQGDSFLTAGLMLNVNMSDNDRLKGYILSFNFDKQRFNQMHNFNISNTGSIFKFTYKKAANSNVIENLTEISDFDAGLVGGNFGSYSRGGRYQGKVKIEIESSKYIITIMNPNGTVRNTITIDEEPSNMYPNNFGFFSEHYSHGCDEIGYFELYNIRINGTEINKWY